MMRERLELVMGRTRRPWGTTGIALAMVCVLVAVGFTRGQDAKPLDQADEIVKFTGVGNGDEVNSEPENVIVHREYDFTATRKLFEANQTLRLAPWHSARSGATQILKGKPIAGVGEHELGAEAAMREWIERVVKESGWSEPVETRISWYGDNKATIAHSKQSDERFERARKALHAKPESDMVLELRVNSLSAADFAKVDLRGLKTVQTDLAALIAEREERKSRLGSANETVSRRISGQNYLISDEAMHRIYPALAKLPSYQCIQAPKLTLMNAQVGKIVTGTTHPFVTKQEPLGKDVEQPLVDVLFRGVQSEMQAIALGENKAWVRWDFQKSDLMGVDSAKQIGSDQMVQEPKLWKVSQTVGVEVAEGETIAMFMKLNQPQEDKRDVLAVFLTLRETVVPVESSQEGNAEAKNAPPANAILASTIRTAVFDVSRTPNLRWFARLGADNQQRAKLIAPAFEQLEILINETIDPESPKVIKRSTDNLTLEVTATQEVLEKVQDLIKQLVRLAEEGEPAVSVTYDVREHYLLLKKFMKAGESPAKLKQGQLEATYAKLVELIKQAAGGADGKGADIKIDLYYSNLTMVVSARQWQQDRIAEMLKQLKATRLDEVEKILRSDGLRESETSRESLRKELESQTDLSPEDQAIYKSLEKRVEAKFKDKPLSEVLKLFGETTKINIVPDMAGFVEEGIETSNPVSLELPQPVSLRSVLQLILDPLGLDFVIKNKALIITSKRLTRGTKTTFAYDIAGLPFFKELWTGLKDKEQPNQAAITAAFEKIQAMIKNMIPAFTEENEPAEIQPFYINLTLVVSATKEDQEKVAALIKQIEKMPLADAEKLAEKLAKEAALRR